MAKKYVIIKGTTMGCHVEYEILVGYDEDGEPEFEVEHGSLWAPTEEIIGKYDSYDLALQELIRLDEQYRRTHRWPWNDGHYVFGRGNVVTITYTDNDDEEWFILREIES